MTSLTEADSAAGSLGPQIDRRAQLRRMRFMLLTAIGLISLALLAGWGWRWYQVYRFIETTDDAFLSADAVRVAPRVNGYVSEVDVTEDSSVKAGQILYKIEAADLTNTVAIRQAELARAQADLTASTAKLAAQGAMIDQAGATLRADRSSVDFATGEASRYQSLASQGVATRQRADGAKSDLERASAMISKDQASILSAKAELLALVAARTSAESTIERDKAALAQAKLDLSRTEIRAPVDGVVGDLVVRPGQYATAGSSLLTIVPVSQIYLTANFKETQVAHMLLGVPVKISLDAFPDMELTGHVEGLSPGTGAQFSLLPAENATGNFTKVVQRVPVRIRLDPDSRIAGRLRPGLSATVTVDTHS